MWHDVKQNTPEWDALRAPRMTSSKLSVIMAHHDTKGAKFGEPAHRYAVDIAVAQLTGQAPTRGYKSQFMQDGHDNEPLAVAHYEADYFTTVTNGGFFDCGDIGCSPDGLIGDDGVLEMKTHLPHIYFDRVNSGTWDSAYRWQIVGNIFLPDREWLDFGNYCPEFPHDKRLFVVRCYRDDFTQDWAKAQSRIEQFRQLIGEKKMQIEKGNYSVIQKGQRK